MDDPRVVLEQVRDQMVPPEGGFDRLRALRSRRRRNQRLTAGVVAVTVFVGSALLMMRALSRGSERPAGSIHRSSAPPAAFSLPSDAIVFSSAESDSLDARIELAFVRAGGGTVVTLTDAQSKGMVAAEPRWSPDGARIAFVMSPRGRLHSRADIYVMNADGSDLRQLTDTVDSSAPAWSPDGSQIVFVRNEGHELVVMDADGSNERVLASWRGHYQ
jgi:hypothetical protein